MPVNKNYRLVQSHTRRLFNFNVTELHIHCDTFATINFYANTFICRSFFILRVVGAPTTGCEGTICFLVVHQAVCLPISNVCVTDVTPLYLVDGFQRNLPQIFITPVGRIDKRVSRSGVEVKVKVKVKVNESHTHCKVCRLPNCQHITPRTCRRRH